MTEKTKLGLCILAAALILGVLGDAWLRVFPWGLNILLWICTLVAALIVLGRWRPEVWQRGGTLLLVPLMLFSAGFLWRDSDALRLMDLFAMLVTCSLLLHRAQGGLVHRAGMWDYLRAGVLAGGNAVLGALVLLLGDIRWPELRGNTTSRAALAVARGLVLALPPLFVFAALFMAADAVFDTVVRTALHVDLDELMAHVLVAGFCAWLVAGYLRGILLGNERATMQALRLPSPALGIIETGVILGLVDALFAAFVLVQIRYLFGGGALVQVSSGLTYADYARSGFFELVTASALALPFLLCMDWLLRADNPAHRRVFQGLAAGLIVLLFCVMCSAVYRMRLYQQEYGLTEQRLYATAFMGWLAVVFVWLVVTVLRGRKEKFAVGALVAGYMLIAALHVLNPDALIVRVNTARAAAGRSFDASYASRLSADAVPTLVAALPILSPQARCLVAERMLHRWPTKERPGWRTWSWARARAQGAVEQNKAALQAMCSGGSGDSR